MLRKCGLFALSLALLSAVSSVFFSDVSSAATIYDSAYQRTHNLILNDQACTEKNVNATDNWASYIFDESLWGNKPAINYYQNAKTSYLQALDTGRWGVSQVGLNNADGSRGIIIFWSTDTSLSLNWLSSQVVAQNVHFVTVGCQKAAFENGQNRYGLTGFSSIDFSGSGSNSVSISEADGGVRNLFVFTDYENYPNGYEGIIIPDSLEPALQFLPRFNYNVSNRDIKLRDTTDRKALTDLEKLTACYFQINPNGEQVFDELEYDCANPPVVDYTFFELGIYDISLIYIYDGKYYRSAETIDVDGRTFSGTVGSDSSQPFDAPPIDMFNGGLSALVTAPMDTIVKIRPGVCTPITFDWYGTKTLPCVGNDIKAALGTPLVVLIQTVWIGIAGYYMGLKILAKINGLFRPDRDDGIEVAQI